MSARSRTVGFAVPIFTRRYSCVESQVTISPPRCCASATPSADFPDAVGPTTATSGEIGSPSLFMEKKCGARETTTPSAQPTPAVSFPQSAGARVSLIRGFERQIIKKVKSQLYVRAAEGWRQRLKRIRRPHRRHGRAVQRFFSRTQQSYRLARGHAAIAHDAELQRHSSAIAQLRRLWHHRVPGSPHTGHHALHVIAEIHAFCRR